MCNEVKLLFDVEQVRLLFVALHKRECDVKRAHTNLDQTGMRCESGIIETIKVHEKKIRCTTNALYTIIVDTAK